MLLHGVLMNGTVWDKVVDGLQDRYRCIVPDLPFGGHSVPMPDDADLTLGSIATMVARFLVELDVQDVTVVCNDWGGAQLIVSPGGSDRIANLVLVSCEAFDNYPPGLPGRLLCLFACPARRHVLNRSSCCGLVGSVICPWYSVPCRNSQIPNALFMSWIHNARHNRKVRRDLTKYLRTVPKKKQLLKWAEQQRSFRGPVLIVWAREDKLMPPTHAERLAGHFENSKLVWVDNSRTLIPIDQPDILTDHIRTFLAPNTSSPAIVLIRGVVLVGGRVADCGLPLCILGRYQVSGLRGRKGDCSLLRSPCTTEWREAVKWTRPFRDSPVGQSTSQASDLSDLFSGAYQKALMLSLHSTDCVEGARQDFVEAHIFVTLSAGCSLAPGSHTIKNTSSISTMP